MLHNWALAEAVKKMSHMLPEKHKCKEIVIVVLDPTKMSDPKDL
jgi:hypothetical protein